jgi:hypothetical protein
MRKAFIKIRYVHTFHCRPQPLWHHRKVLLRRCLGRELVAQAPVLPENYWRLPALYPKSLLRSWATSPRRHQYLQHKHNSVQLFEVQLKPISKCEWNTHLNDLWTIKQEEEPIVSATTDENVDPVAVQELIETMKYNRNKKFWEELIVYLLRHGPHRKLSLQQFIFSAGMCLPSHCLATIEGCTYRSTDSSLIRHGLHRKQRVQKLCCCLCIRCRGNVFLPKLFLARKRGYTYRHTDWWEGFMKYAVEMGSVAMI